MYHYKGFDSATFDDDMARMESTVNEWMRGHHPRIRMMTQSPRGTHIVLSFVYEEHNDSEGQLASKVAVPEVFERTLEDADLDPQEVEDPEDLDDMDDIELPGLPEAELPY
ncbi:MAG TPA: hypothetical protein VIC85_06765 [Ktedonobacterales bacterium]